MPLAEFISTTFRVSDDCIIPIQENIYLQETWNDAVTACLYTHRLHDGNACSPVPGIIHCPQCGQIHVSTKIRSNK